MNKRGYITLAQQSGNIDYLRMAYGLALSLKATQREVSNLTVIVTPGTKIPKEYVDVFDEILEISDDAAKYETWKIHNKWKVYQMSPYDETILVDADMIFPMDVSDWWDTLYERDVWITTQPVTYRGVPIKPKTYRQEFIVNNLPMVYTAFAYFRKCPAAQSYFDTVRAVYHGWKGLYRYYHLRTNDDEMLLDMALARSPDRWSWTHFFQNFPPSVSGDLAFAVAMKIMGTEDQFTQDGMFPTFTHMKPADQGVALVGDALSNMFPVSIQDDLTLLVGHYRQRYPFHYVEKGWLTADIITKLERAVHG